MVFYIYEVPGEKNGATKDWETRRQYNFNKYLIEPILIETMEGTDTEEFWQVVGDREWELADINGYDRGTHYRTARLQRLEMNRRGAASGGRAGKGVPNRHLRSLTIEQVDEIKSKYVRRIYGLVKLSKEYNVSGATISNIINNKYYTAP